MKYFEGQPVIGYVKLKGQKKIPVIDGIDPAKDREGTRECIIRNYRREHGHDPESMKAAELWYLDWLEAKEPADGNTWSRELIRKCRDTIKNAPTVAAPPAVRA